METRTASAFETGNNPYGYAPGFWRRVQERRRAEKKIAAELAEKERRMERIAALKEQERRLNQSPAPPAIRFIIEAVADEHGVPAHAITGKRHSNRVFAARNAAIRAVANARPDWSLGMIGRVFGNRHHTSILSSLKKTRQPGEWR